jgi:hypothetical protein
LLSIARGRLFASPHAPPERQLSTVAVQHEPTPVPMVTPAHSIESTRRPLAAWLVLLVVLVLSAVYVFWHLRRGWIPHDEGALAQSAERLLQGELPHRDFDDIYTGGLAYVDATAFRLFGTTLWSMRLALFAVFLAWVPAVFYLASRFVKPVAAGGMTLLAVVWSLPNYVAPMPSWYNLFLATFGVAALFRHLEDGRRRWLVAAGLAGGLSFLIKVVGLYYVAGVLLFLVFQAHALARAAAGVEARRGVAYQLFVSASLLLFVAVLAALVRHQLQVPEVIQFIVPGTLIAALLVRNEWTLPAGESRARFAVLARLLLPFFAGLALPVALFLIPYAVTGALGTFAHGVFILPAKRFSAAVIHPLALSTMIAVVPVGILIVGVRRMKVQVRRWELGILAVALLLVLIASARVDELYRFVWYSVRSLLPVLTIAGVLTLARTRTADTEAPLLRAQTMLLLSVAALCTLVQFPFAAPIYFCYVAPLIGLVALALFRYLRPVAPAVPGLLVAFYIAFAVFRVNTSALYGMGTLYLPYFLTEPLASARGGIDVPRFQNAEYREVLPLLRQHARGGYTWASPDAPEIYFLSGLKNPTRSLFEFFDDQEDRTVRVLRALDGHGVTAIVLNARPEFSPGITMELFQELAKRYPNAVNVGHFHVRWRS